MSERFLVMRLAPMIGRQTSARRVSVCHRTSNLGIAVSVARNAIGPREAYWVVEAGKPAHLRGTRTGTKVARQSCPDSLRPAPSST